ncbi:MAG TPA: MmgE/PrpD family protein [Xanthobacteraceae bacterium]|nr:MmgE/PrpD family protein [Xanthobacteraceae bacterium]
MSLEDTTRWLAQAESLPADVDAKARLLLLDTFGCLLAGLRHPQVQELGRALRLAFPGNTAWPSSDIRLGAAGAAALGAAAACWDEACEGHSSAHGRPGLPVVPALLALSATHDVSLGALLVALVTGYEIGTRAGQAWRIPPGWHVDGSWHSLGVAAAVARLTSGPARIAPAIEAAACQIPASLYLPISTGSVARNTYPAHAALLGMLAAAAAVAGFRMPDGALEEARRRVLRAASDASPTPAGQWTILEGYLKPFAGVRHTHYGVEAALRLRARHAIRADAVTAIRLQVYPEAVQYCGNRAPRSAIQAQFSLTYAIAAALVLGDVGPDAYTNVDDPRISRLEQLVVVDADATRLRRGATVAIEFAGERVTESVDAVAGDPALPMSRDQVVDKFRRYTEPVIGERSAASFVQFFLEGAATEPARRFFTLVG